MSQSDCEPRRLLEQPKQIISVETDEARVRPEASEVDRLWAANAKASEIYGWTPSHGGLGGFHKGIAKTVEWFSEPANRAAYKPGTYNV